MKEHISKIKISGAYGINELEITPKSITEIVGPTGSGKTSVLDAIKLLFTNKGNRTRYIKNGEKEADLFITIDNGTVINRTKKREGTDKISIRENGVPIDSTPQAFINKLFSEEQFNPLKFVELSEIEQKRILLSLLEIGWTKEKFLEWFGEIPKEVDENKHILEILEMLGSDKSEWYEKREETGRLKRHCEAVRDDHFKGIPEGYKPEEWRNVNLADKYSLIEKKSAINNQREKCEIFVNTYSEKLENINNKYALRIKEQEELKEFKIDKAKKIIEDSKKTIEYSISEKEKEILKLEALINDLKLEIKNEKERINILEESKFAENKEAIEKEIAATIKGIEEAKFIEIEKYEEQRKLADEFIKSNPLENIEILKTDAENAEKMKGFISAWDKAIEKQREVDEYKCIYDNYTHNIEYARRLPAILLEQSKVPIQGLKLENGEILIKNTRGEYMTISNLSDGEKMKLAITIAAAKSKELGVVFCDGSEKMDEKTYRDFITECAKTGLQFFFTRTTEGEFEVKTYDLKEENVEINDNKKLEVA